MTEDKDFTYDLQLPPFWGNSDILVLNENNDKPIIRVIYCYIPVITVDNSLILIDPYEETKELCQIDGNIIKKEFSSVHPEGDFITVIAMSSDTDMYDLNIDDSLNFIANEIKRGVPLPKYKGSYTHVTDRLSADSLDELICLLGIENRLAVDFDENFKSLNGNFNLSFFFPNTTSEN